MSLLIRLATPDDATEVSRFNQLFNGVETPAPQMAAQIRAAADVESAILADWDGQAVGIACLRLIPSLLYAAPYAEITELYVEPAFRRRGVARALMARAESLARQFGAREMVLLTGFRNVTALDLYHELGYEDHSLGLHKKLS
jgi:GNAT superfamily N-acetyltransferase